MFNLKRMKEGQRPLEKISPRLKPGRLDSSGDEIKFVRSQDHVAVHFPKAAIFYLECFNAGKTIEQIVLESYSTGHSVDFGLLKQTLYTLYWSKSLINENEFKKAIELSDWMPSIESHLINPIAEFAIERNNTLDQFIAILFPVAIIFISVKLFLASTPRLIILFLFPSLFFSVKGLLSAIGHVPGLVEI
jgi:hypothetical protein